MVRVFFVDDEISIRKGLEKIIKWEEYGVEIVGEASNGEEALQKMMETRAEIIITDVKMPIMDGLSLVREIKKIYKNIKIIIISGYDDFEYVKEALKYGVENYLTKPINEDELSNTIINCVEKIESERKLATKLRQDEEVIRNNLIYRLLRNIISKNEMVDKMKYINLDQNSKQFQVSIVKPLFEDSSKIDLDIVKFCIINICNEVFSISFKFSIVADYEGNIVIVLFDNQLSEKQKNIKRLLMKCSENIQKYIKTDTFISVGNIEYSIFDIYKSYDLAMHLTDYAFVCPANSIKIYDEVEEETNAIKDFQTSHLNELPMMIKKGNLSYVTQFYEVILENTYNFSPDKMYNVAVQILIEIIELIKVEELVFEEITGVSENLYVYLFKDISLDIMLRRMEELTIHTTRQFLKIAEKPKPITIEIIEYIDSHYNEELSLKTIANLFNINSAYLGQLFKKESGMMFTEYLNNIRIASAKTLLLQTELSSNEISAKVGYSNSNYFYRVFKKYTGIYPTDYREQART